MENIINTVGYSKQTHCPGYRYLAYPLLLAGNAVVIVGLGIVGLPLELTLTLAFMGSLVVLGLHERILPFRADWQPNRREWLQNLGQFLPNGLLDNAGQLVALLIAMQFGAQQPLLPLVLSVPLAIVTSEFFSYWIHRLGHEVPWLWKVHGIHHTPDKVNLVNTNTINFLDMFFSSLVSALPLVLLGFSSEAIALALFFTGLQNFIVHVNADIRLGKLEQVFMGPAHHRLHHSVIISEAQNFGTSITLWDRLFGTYISPAKTPLQVGIAQPNTFPDSAEVVRSQLYPFSGW